MVGTALAAHIVAIIRIPHTYPARFRLYDNDSAERRSGTFASVHADYIIRKAQNLYLTTERDSPLARALSPPSVGSASGEGMGGVGAGGRTGNSACAPRAGA